MPDPSSYSYKAFGLNILSQFEVPGFQPASFSNADVTIESGHVPETIDPVINKGVLFQANDHEFILRIVGIASYYIKYGTTIRIQPQPKAVSKDIAAFLTGTCFGALLHQRKLLPLHAGTVVFKNRCLVFMGLSGAGKSTLAAAFLKAGATLVADDISVIDFSGERPAVRPAFPAIKMWQDSLKHLDYATDGLVSVREELKKFYMPVLQFSEIPVPVDTLFILNSYNKPDALIKSIEGMDKFQAVIRHTYLFRGIPKTGLEQNHFILAGKLITTIPLFMLSRPDSHFNTDNLLELIKEKAGING
ncbi:MAG TPA: hypothetical protein VK179_05730 [Bacteroidales bacterium]|nr:hypothetical protein [Bacteroidales bacterium]